MSISKDEVRHVAKLARLELSEEEIEKFSNQLSQILEHAARVQELDLENLEPLTHAVDRRNVFRSDEVKECLSREEALSNAPEREGEFFKIPPIV
ncbi:MAG: Asp-tRNA(Asn)/Glu-tRNA(Gln) amidotransferase subunit GatC [Actinobacteria bacterium]|nr:Asp-tRNA(Asn)/Glu-tRNA(Gln) amidotransferase subunit GatC [Actinomycetota bacterium]